MILATGRRKGRKAVLGLCGNQGSQNAGADVRYRRSEAMAWSVTKGGTRTASSAATRLQRNCESGQSCRGERVLVPRRGKPTDIAAEPKRLLHQKGTINQAARAAGCVLECRS